MPSGAAALGRRASSIWPGASRSTRRSPCWARGRASIRAGFFVLSQFVAYFTYSNMGTMLALSLANLFRDAPIGPFWLLIGFIAVVVFIDLFITGAAAKWAIFAPIFVPVLMKLGVAPEAVMAASRLADSPSNMITPVMSAFALILTFFQRYDKNAGTGTLIALMLPYFVWILVGGTALFTAWYFLGLPWSV
jgi:aminobenzoyl-glutamate transport protein